MVFSVQPFILASKSPRRREILQMLGIPFEIYDRKSHWEDSQLKDPGQYVLEVAEKKAIEPRSIYKTGIVLTADTIVYCDGEILGKPIDKIDATAMIAKLQGKTHQVYTGICLSDCTHNISRSAYEITDVTFAPMSHNEIEWYINGGEYPDKAGAYAVQGKASLFITGIKGCFFNVVGLPVRKLFVLSKDMNI